MRWWNGRTLSTLAVAVAASACAATTPTTQAPATSRAADAGSGNVHAGIDATTHPGEDFWEYVNGNWERSVQIPADRGALTQVSRLTDLAASQVRDILDEFAAKRDALEGDERRVAAFWTSLLDHEKIEARGNLPLMQELAPALSARNHGELASEMGHLVRGWSRTPFAGRITRYIPAPFFFLITPDSRDPDTYVPAIRQSGLGMPSRDYYLKDDATAAKTQAAYRLHLARLLELTGAEPADAVRRAEAVYEFERRIAESHWTVTQSLDADANYNSWTIEELERRAPGFAWASFFRSLGISKRPRILVSQPDAVSAIARNFAGTPLPVLKDWLTARMAKDRASVLPQAFLKAEASFTSGVLGGSTEVPPRWLQAIELTSAAMTDAVSKPYAERHFPPSTKRAVEEMVGNVRAAMHERIKKLDWMRPETKAKALTKLASLQALIGYPDSWRSYARLEVDSTDAYGNFARAAAFEHARRLSRIDARVDRREWFMMPIIPNATLSPTDLQIIFSAAYLQPPYFDPNADIAVNYGAIGYIIGHEISHHFDNMGSRFDEKGRLADWWTDHDRSAFENRTRRLAEQFGSYEILPGLYLDGHQTLAENIADNAGLAVAYDAYRRAAGADADKVLDGLSGDQRFFIAFARVHRAKAREETLRRWVISGTYAPPRWRTWSVRNLDGWYDAFGVGPEHRLYLRPEERVRIW